MKFIENHLASITVTLLFLLPMAVHFFGNFYWWLWDGNSPDVNKMLASFMGMCISAFALVFILVDLEQD